jgi:sugar lactone lactonase YvrE
MESNNPQNSIPNWLDRPLTTFLPKFTLGNLLIVLILIAAVISRFYILGERVMDHDEVNHVVPSYSFYQGNGYSHDPVTHGPMQFHLIAASYFIFGDNDFTSRIPVALFSIATIAFVMIGYRRYLGKTGAILAGLFFLISPYMLFYGRYTRNEAFVALFSVIMLYTVLRYLEEGKHSTLFLYTAVVSLHFCTKETAFISTAAMLIFLALLFLKDVIQKKWKQELDRNGFILSMIIALVLVGAALGIGVLSAKNGTSPETTQAVLDGITTQAAGSPLQIVLFVCLGLAFISLVFGFILLFTNIGIRELRKTRSFDLLILTVSLVLPQLIAFPLKFLGWNPLDYSQPGLIRTSIALIIAVLMAVGLGMIWKPKLWLLNTAIFYGIFTVLYTSVFTNGQGFFTGMVGSLGYWLSQQAVNRGTQPWYYYSFLQIPMYEYLAALGAIVAFVIGVSHNLFNTKPNISPALQINDHSEMTQLPLPAGSTEDEPPAPADRKLPVLTLLLYWSIINLIAYSVAGEKMPWLTVHITLPMLLASGFALGFLVDRLDLKSINRRTVLAMVLLPVFLISLGKTIGLLAGPTRPFSGNELAQLQITSTFLFAIISAVLSGWGVLHLLADWASVKIFRLFVVTFFGVLAFLTTRSAYQANYINQDTAKEFLVYAHAARGPKDVLKQVEDISLRITGGKDIKVAYIGDALYPYWWYFRDYPNKTWFENNLTRDLLQYPLVISDDDDYTKTQAILKDGYVEFTYKRLLWPMQDYFNLKLPQVWKDFKDPQMRKAIFEIWLNKDYSLYGKLKNNPNLTVETWQPSASIHFFIQKDIVAKIWSYGVLPTTADTTVIDPYVNKFISLTPEKFFGAAGTLDGQFTSPRGIAVGLDGSIYVADSRNHRIQRFSASGEWLSSWGTYASVDAGEAPGGTFNEPWGIAVGPDGSVYVADTWNYRIQKFTSDGKFVTMWGKPGTADSPTTFWGPRGIVVDKNGHVFITDTGNNRVVIFDDQGNYLNQFGINGINPGEFDEPVGLAVDSSGRLYVVDTWNQRTQVFESSDTNASFQFVYEWSVAGWYGQSVNNKPFIAVDQKGNVFVTDPDGFRVLEFNQDGVIQNVWGDYSSGIDGFGKPAGLALSSDGKLWVSDADNNYILQFSVPASSAIVPSGLPELPVSATLLTYNLSTGFVENPLKQPVYRLNSDGLSWVPVIPESLITTLPISTIPELIDGSWVLRDSDKNIHFKWDNNLLLWISIGPTIPTSTP